MTAEDIARELRAEAKRLRENAGLLEQIAALLDGEAELT